MSNRRKFLQQTLAPAGALCLSTILPAVASAATKASGSGASKTTKMGTGTAANTNTGTAAAAAKMPVKAVESSPLSRKLQSMNRATAWKLVDSIKVQFKTFHCQGMVKIGEFFWVSSVEIEIPAGGSFDWRKGKGHLFKIDASGKLAADIPIGEGTIYHPSGIDFDGTHIWIAAAEYRPDSQAIIYRFDPVTMKLQEMFRWQDHIGGILRNPLTDTLHGISWGSRRFYQWQLDKSGNVIIPAGTPRDLARLNTSYYIDYQDNQYIGGNEILYTGLSVYKKPDGTRIAIGGMEIVDLSKQLPVHQQPVELWSPATGASITQNPSWFELSGDMVRASFMPDDNESTIYVYEA